MGRDDLDALARAGADALLVPKVSSPQDVLRYHEALTNAPSDLQLWAMIETAGSVLRLDAIASLARQTRLALWVIGPNDLAREFVPGPMPNGPFFSRSCRWPWRRRGRMDCRSLMGSAMNFAIWTSFVPKRNRV
jgi:citrate lyase beta subunit